MWTVLYYVLCAMFFGALVYHVSSIVIRVWRLRRESLLKQSFMDSLIDVLVSGR